MNCVFAVVQLFELGCVVLKLDCIDRSQGVYESHIAELGEKGRVASLNTQRSPFQRVQFLYGEGGRSCFLALFLLNEFVSLYQIPVTVTQGRMYISGKIQPLQSIQRKVLWFSWDMQRQRIYMLYPHPNNLSELMFKSVQFTEVCTLSIHSRAHTPVT